MLSKNEVFSINSFHEFEAFALQTFYYQAKYNVVYKEFLTHLKINASDIKSISEIPFLPIDFFKNHKIIVNDFVTDVVFTSSGTTSKNESKHLVKDISWYVESFRNGFKESYGEITDYCILALLPNYQERIGSSLIYMVDDLIKNSNYDLSGYFLHQNSKLFETLNHLKNYNKKTILFGVTYALLEFIETYQLSFPNLVIIETGGMKGKRKEIIRDDLHKLLKLGFGVDVVHSEYGMTELLSQAYSKNNGVFQCPNWMNVYVRDINDPFNILDFNKIGGINVVDLANQNSCSFIATQDLGKKIAEGRFEILGRFDYSDLRGCNLMVAS